MLLHLGQLLHLGLQHTSQSSWLLLTKYIWALVSVWFIISSKPCGWYTALILWSVPHNLNSSSLTLLTNSWPWSDITIFASLYLVIRLYRKSATPRGPIYIYLSEQVKFKPRLTCFGFVKTVSKFWYLWPAIRKENYGTELPLERLFCAPIQKRACLITVLDRLTTNVVNIYIITCAKYPTLQLISDITYPQPISL